MFRGRLVVALLGLLWAASSAPATAQTQEPPSAEAIQDRSNAAAPLRVGIKEAIPFSVIKDDVWTGLSVDLWRAMADELGVRYQFQEMPLEQLFTSLESGELDLAIAALTVTREREQRVDFTHSYFTTGLSIAISGRPQQVWSAVARRIFSAVFLEIILGILVLLVVSGMLVYFFERRKNPADFGQGPLYGIANGIWWAAVTMTTVGYGDRVPKSLGGRLAAIVWMFAGILIISSFTASVTSTLTVARLESQIRGPRDLKGLRVATIDDSTGADYLARQGIAHQTFASPEKCLQLLQAGEVDAVVHDAPILRYLCLSQYPGELEVLKDTFEKQHYAIALPQDSPLRESLNRALLNRLAQPDWPEAVHRYLGSAE